MDQNGDGKIDFEEFLPWYAEQTNPMRPPKSAAAALKHASTKTSLCHIPIGEYKHGWPGALARWVADIGRLRCV